MWSLDRIFGLYTVLFLGTTVLIGIGERVGLFSNQMIGWLFMAHVAGHLRRDRRRSRGRRTPTSTTWPGRNVPAFYNGMATGSDWMSAASFISMAGALSVQGFSGLAYVMGWTGGYLLLAVFLGPYLRQFGAYTIPDFLGARYGGNMARIIGVVAAIACSLMYLIAQVTGVGFIVARFIGIDFNVGVFVGPARRAVLLGARRHEVGDVDPGRPVHHPDHSYLVPVVYLSWSIFSIPIPELTYGQLLQRNNAARHRGDPRRQGEGDARALEEGRRRGQRQDQGRRPPRGRGGDAQGARPPRPRGRRPLRPPVTTPSSVAT